MLVSIRIRHVPRETVCDWRISTISLQRIVLVDMGFKLLSEPTSSPNLSILTTPGRTSVVGSGPGGLWFWQRAQQGIRRDRLLAPAGQWLRRTP